jgi:adenylylsulfate kinase
MKIKILIMGLPGAGKTTLAEALRNLIQDDNKTVEWFNADLVRQAYDDWDFSVEGRIRQSVRMRELANKMHCDYVLCDFVCPLPVMRDNFDADFIIWVDTIDESRYADTNQIFVSPEKYDIKVDKQDAEKWAKIIYEQIKNKYERKV